MKLPNADRAFVDIAKLRDYSLDPVHWKGKHKARVFASALGLTRNDAQWLCDELRPAVYPDSRFGARRKDLSHPKRLEHSPE